MKKSIHRAVCVFFCIIVLCACLPASAFAVDPVSAGIMANAFAQAIAAYGASNGVAMTFDVANTNGIGESVHELWSQFRAGTQDADDYATLAAALFPNLYYKAANVVGAAADVYTVGYNISSTYAEQFDNFYNWLLSGPAEMTKVDNQYYQFSQAQVGPNSVPIQLIAGGGTFSNQPVPYISSPSADSLTFSAALPAFTNANGNGDVRIYAYGSAGVNASVYAYLYTNQWLRIGFASTTQNVEVATIQYANGNYNIIYPLSLSQYDDTTGLYYNFISQGYAGSPYYLPYFASASEARASIASWLLDPDETAVGVKAYDNTGVASFPDTTDPNYEAVSKRIPSDIPWDDTLFGDGTGTLTDAQSGSIAAEADQVLAEDGVLTLAGDQTDNPGPDDEDEPSSDPDDYLAVGLEDIFPFCIPFDIYNFLSALAAEPVAPHFTATLAFPQVIGGSQTIELDFDSPTWNQLAQLLRLLELLAFIVGLALLTRSMFIRG